MYHSSIEAARFVLRHEIHKNHPLVNLDDVIESRHDKIFIENCSSEINSEIWGTFILCRQGECEGAGVVSGGV